MKGIIIKPKRCCGYSASIGNIVEYVGKIETEHVRCTSCFHVRRTGSGDILVDVNGFRTGIEDHRIKWFNDDVDLSDEVEKSKELETA